MDIIDNINNILKDNLVKEIKKGSKISIAAASFSIYAYDQLKKELDTIDEFRFIYTSPTFIKESTKKDKREFYIPKKARESNLFGSEFEVKLRNEMTQKAIAKECADWIRRKGTFKSNVSSNNLSGFITVDDKSYSPINDFTTIDLGIEKGNDFFQQIYKNEIPNSESLLNIFEDIWNNKEKLEDITEKVIENITTVYKENTPEYLYYVTLYNIFSEFLEDVSEDELPNEATGFKNSKTWNTLYNFQEDAAVAIINKLEKYNGCILADSVGLGKTFTALAVIKYYENRNKSVLVLCPKKLASNWNTYRENYVTNILVEDRLNYDVLFHTDLNRDSGSSNGKELDRINWSNYDLVVIDESHNFRNGGKISGEDGKENRYFKLLNKVIRKGVKTKVLMLSATPVNNKFTDLKNQLALAYEGESKLLSEKLKVDRNIDDIFRSAQTAFNNWSKLEVEERTSDNLLKTLDYDFFELLDSVTIARSRKHIQHYYDTSKIGVFPVRNKPISKRPGLSDLSTAVTYNEIFEQLNILNLSIYTPSDYILKSKLRKYIDLHESSQFEGKLTQIGREMGIKRLMSINLMKRLESSVHSFKLTLHRIRNLITDALDEIVRYEKSQIHGKISLNSLSDTDLDGEDQEDENFIIGQKVRIDIADMDYTSWNEELRKDKDTLDLLISMVNDITPVHDEKLETLLEVIDNKIRKPINKDNKKILIFTAFADTADYLYENVSKYVKDTFNLSTAIVTGSTDGRTTIKGVKSDLNTVLTLFSPKSKDKSKVLGDSEVEIDILIATDVISEGQNLQDCDYLINYDIHWNPVRIIQRFGRIDRIGSQNSNIQLVNFWPDITLDEYINLKARVETRMKIVDMTATGDDDVLSSEEKMDLEYRKKQLRSLQDEVVDLEDVDTGISIVDLGLNEFRLDLLDYVNKNPGIEVAPKGMHAVIEPKSELEPGVIFVLRNIKESINVDNQNRLPPFYMIYLSDSGEVFIDYLKPKAILDSYRYLCKGVDTIDSELYKEFNIETNDGKDMTLYSDLLHEAIKSIINIKEENDLDSFLKGKQVSFLDEKIEGLDDFELISFLVVKDKEGSNA